MKPFKKQGFWLLFVFVVLIGAFFIVNSGTKNQSAVIQNVEAQMYGLSLGYGSGSTGLGGMMPQNILFSQNSTPMQEINRSSFPGNVMFAGQQLHPGSYMFTFPWDIAIEGSNGKTQMRTILTCTGCALTMSTCDWNCGRTFSFCNTGNIYGDRFTGLTCPGTTSLPWGDSGYTNLVCPTGTICGIGGNTNMSCSTNLSGCGQTALFCPRQFGLYGGIGLYDGIGSATSGLGCPTAYFECGGGLLGITPNPSPAF